MTILLYNSCHFSCLALTDSFHFCQPFRLLFNNLKGFFPEFIHNSFGKTAANAGNGSGAKITEHGNFILRILSSVYFTIFSPVT